MIKKLNKLLTMVEVKSRRTGRTTAMIEVALKTNGIFLVHDHNFEIILKKKYPALRTFCSINKASEFTSPVFIDHYFLAQIISDALKEIEQLKIENESLKRELVSCS
jgi:hypothetical protein